MDKEQIKAIIEQLENVKARLPFYVSDELPPVANFLQGFHLACIAFGASPEEVNMSGSIPPRRNWKDTDIGLELMALAIENWKAKLI